MTVFTRIAAAALVGAALSAPAVASEWTGPRLVGSGDNVSVEHPAPSLNIHGGALVRLAGSGESVSTEVLAVRNVATGRIARLVGSGETLEVVEVESTPAQRLAQFGQRG